METFPDVLTNLWPFKQAFNGLKRRIQTTVEHMRVTNNEDTALARGEVLILVAGSRVAERADATTEAGSLWACVACEPTPASGTGITRIDGKGYVLFEDGLDPAPAAGDAVYVSDTAGRATNDNSSPTWLYKIGIVADASPYATESACWVWLNHCCTPEEMVG